MGSKGSNTYTTNSQGPAWLQSAYQGLVNQAQNTASTPYVPYGGELVAGVNPQETAGINAVNQYSNWAQPYLNAAAGMTVASGAPISQQTIQQYANPEAAAVSQSTLNWMNNLNAQQNQNLIGNAVSSGAWGGDRASVAQANLAGQQASAEAPTLANIQSQAYTTGLSTALTEQQQQAASAASLANIGTAAQTAGLTGAGAQIQGGQLQQATQQSLDQAQLQQYYTALGYPFETSAWLAGIETGVGSVAGGTSQTTAPAPNPLNSLLGIGAAGLGAYLGAKRGGGINAARRYDGGGGISIFGGEGTPLVPSVQMGRGAGPPKPPIDPSFMLMYGQRDGQGGQSGMTPGLGAKIGKGLAGMGQGIDTSGAGSGFPRAGSEDANALENIGGDSIDADVLGLGEATGGGVWPQHAGLGFRGFADGGDPADPYGPVSAFSPINKGDFLRLPDDPAGVLNADSPYNQANNPLNPDSPAALMRTVNPDPYNLGSIGKNPDRLPQPTVGYTGTDMPPGAGPTPGTPVMNADTLGLTGTGHPPPMEGTESSGSIPARPMSYAPPARSGVGAAAQPTPYTSPDYLGPSYEDASRRPEDTRTLGQKLSLPLMQAGFALMASRSPFLGVGIGEGGLAGIGAYIQQEREKRTSEEKQQDIQLRAKQLSDAADRARKQLQQTHDYQQQEIEERQNTPHPIGSDMFGKPIYGILDPKTHGYVDPITRQPIDMDKINQGREGNMQATAHMIANYAMPPISPFKSATPEGAALMAAVMKENPQYNAQYYNESNKARTDFSSGPDGRAVQSFSVGISHLDVLDQAADALSRGLDIRTIRTLQQAWQKEFGTSTAPTDYNAIKPIVADEIAKAVVGGRGGTQQDREQMAAGIGSELATASIKSVIDKYQKLMGGQLAGYERRYRTATHGATDFEDKLSPAGVNMLHEGQAAEQAAGARTAVPAGGDATPAPAGSTIQNGVLYGPDRKPIRRATPDDIKRATPPAQQPAAGMGS